MSQRPARLGPFAALLFALVLVAPTATLAQAEKPPTGPALRKIVVDYLGANEARRAEMREQADKRYGALASGPALVLLRKEMLKFAATTGRKIEWTGTNYFLDEKEKRGKYISRAGASKTLFIGLHGGGVGEGSAESMAGAMGGGGWNWIFPEVLEKTEHGWTTSGTEEFVLELIDAAKRSQKIDPDRIYITGHSMGGFGTWTLGAHHADLFGGTAAYAGAPSPLFDPNDQSRITGIVRGVLPNLFALRHFFFQSLDDQNVPPGPNIHANKALLEWKKEHPDGFEYRYDETDGLGHAPPKEGYLPTQKWVADKKRNARPAKFLWEPVLPWKRHFYWAYWREIPTDGVYEFKAKPDNSIDVGRIGGTAAAPAKLTLFLGAPLIDLEKEVVVRIEGKEKYRGKPTRTFSTLLLTLPRFDDALLYDARIDL